MDSPKLSVKEAADALGLHPRRVRAMIGAGALDAERVAGRWLIPAEEVVHTSALDRPPGRPLRPSRAWALVFLIDGRTPDRMSRHELSRTRSYLRRIAPMDLLPRLRRRASLRRFRAHPSDLPRLLEEKAIVMSGVSAAARYDANVFAPGTVEGCIRADDLERLIEKYHLMKSANANVRLHVVDDEAWPFGRGERIAPAAAVALDLLEAGDERSRRAGRELLSHRGFG